MASSEDFPFSPSLPPQNARSSRENWQKKNKSAAVSQDMQTTESGFFGENGGNGEGGGMGAMKLHQKKLGADGKKAATWAVRAGGSLAVGTIVQRRKRKIIILSISPPKNKSTYRPRWNGDSGVLNLLHGGVRHLAPLIIQNQHIQLFLQRFLPLVLHQGCPLQWLHVA